MRPVLFTLLDGTDYAVSADLIGSIEHDPDGGGSIVTLKDGEVRRVNESVRYAFTEWTRALAGAEPVIDHDKLAKLYGMPRDPSLASFEASVAYRPGDRVTHKGVEKVIGKRPTTFAYKPAYVAPAGFSHGDLAKSAGVEVHRQIDEAMEHALKPLPESPEAKLAEVRRTFERLGGKFDGGAE